jgi:hypothetical protein
MPALAIRNILHVLIAVAVLLNAWPSLRPASAPHDVRDLQGVEISADLGLADAAEHTHTHDDDPDLGTLPTHGHEHKDHSHVTFGLPAPAAINLRGPEGTLVRVRQHCPPSDDLVSRLDRPPC